MLDLREALEVATRVALDAGARIRREFHRPGGPRGGGDKANIDYEIEVDLRRALLERFPGWAYTGEETGSQDGPLPYRWMVDPQDGTRVFLQGFRGSSVSIGLLHEDQPVLGVVYSPTYPDGRGDLITWAAGCGPVRRNGQELSPPEWPSELRPHDMVLVSQHADRRAPGNLVCVTPARFRKMPSVAYRLALVAAGEGVAGVSLAGVSAHDVVAAHALLRGQGGELLDHDGEVMRYVNGVAATRAVFGGGLAVCRILRGRPWGKALQGVRPETGDFEFPLELTRGQAIEDADLLARAQGCWLGQLTGDSLGSLVEFSSPEWIDGRYPDGGPHELHDGGYWQIMAGQPTDDSELALALARTVIAHGRFDRDEVWEAYRRWYRSHPFDMGQTTRQALSQPRPQLEGKSESQANGALMRCSPLALLGFRRPAEMLEWSDEDASLTHPHPVCLSANRAYLRGIAAGLRGGSAEEAYAAALDGALGPVRETLEAARREPPSDYVSHQGWVLKALQNAFYHLLNTPTWKDALVATVRRGGDTDTNACIAGALLGALHGREAIPLQWRQMVLSCRPHGEAQAFRPRPAFCWPVDAHEQAEWLLLCGEGA